MLTGKIALVTGASRGIGKATAITLASYGATVIVKIDKSRGSVKPLGVKNFGALWNIDILAPADVNDGVITHDKSAVPNDAVTHHKFGVYNSF